MKGFIEIFPMNVPQDDQGKTPHGKLALFFIDPLATQLRSIARESTDVAAIIARVQPLPLPASRGPGPLPAASSTGGGRP